MKINKAKLLVGTLAIASVAATVGSISGTVAWFQYSTRSTVAYQGAAAHCSENLQIRINAGTEEQNPWSSDLTTDKISAYLSAAVADGGAARANGVNLHPVTSGKLATDKVAADLYKNPIYQYQATNTWGKAGAEDFILLPLELRVKDVDGTATPAMLAKKIYITDITMEARANHTGYVAADHLDLSSALRVGVTAGTVRNSATAGEWNQFATFSKSGEDVDVSGKLDLNGDTNLDRDGKYDWAPGNEITYGDAGEVAKSTVVTQIAQDAEADTKALHRVANDTNAAEIVGTEIGATTAAATLKVDLKIYLEGWTTFEIEKEADYASLEALVAAKEADVNFDVTKTYKAGTKYYVWDETLNAPTGGFKEADAPRSALWDATKGIGAEFNLGIRFSAEAHADHQ